MKLNRNLYRAFLLLSFLMINGFILYGINAVLSYLNTGADRSTILHLPEQLSANYLPKVKWSPLENEGRLMEKQTLKEIERDYLKAWYVRNMALKTNNKYGIADYYSDSARTKLFQILDLNRKNETTLKTTTVAHHPKLNFYSEDGKLVVFTDENVESYEEIYKDGILILKQSLKRSYKVLLLLEDGFWRIRHIVEISASKKTETNSKVTLQQSQIKAISKIKGINYYPKKSPWNMFGEKFNDSIISSDFSKVNDLGLNTIRLFVPYSFFGKSEVSAEKLRQLKTTLDLAEANELKTIITLFDFYGDYGLQNWTLTHRHVEQIVLALKDYNAILAWDIKNEPDLDFKSRGKENVIAWLKQMILEIKKYDKKHPVTIGWSSPEAAENLNEEVDFISFHYYNKPSDFLDSYGQLKTSITDKNKPLVLQEYGYSSYDGIWNGFFGSEENQAKYYKEIQTNLEKEKIPYLFWTLYDFEEVPNSVVGRLPWRKKRQQFFGIINSNDEPKPAFKLLDKKRE